MVDNVHLIWAVENNFKLRNSLKPAKKASSKPMEALQVFSENTWITNSTWFKFVIWNQVFESSDNIVSAAGPHFGLEKLKKVSVSPRLPILWTAQKQ